MKWDSRREPMSRRQERAAVSAAQRGSEEAIERLFRAHWPRAYRAALTVARDPAAAEDIAQEAFLAAIRRLDRFDRRRPFGPWLHRIAVNRAIDWTRARKLRREQGSESIEDYRSPEDRSGQGESDPRAERLAEALDSLSPEHRAVIAMRYVLELGPGEIAAELDLPRGTVNSRLRRGLDQLGGRLEGGDG
jgi:RNA polymerase sigma-70 factor (ECF subfamily)